MYEQLSTLTVEAKRFSWKRIGSLPGCLALSCADIGTAELQSGETVYVTWGRNIDRVQQHWYATNTNYQPIHLGADDGSAELILPQDVIDKLLPLLVS